MSREHFDPIISPLLKYAQITFKKWRIRRKYTKPIHYFPHETICTAPKPVKPPTPTKAHDTDWIPFRNSSPLAITIMIVSIMALLGKIFYIWMLGF